MNTQLVINNTPIAKAINTAFSALMEAASMDEINQKLREYVAFLYRFRSMSKELTGYLDDTKSETKKRTEAEAKKIGVRPDYAWGTVKKLWKEKLDKEERTRRNNIRKEQHGGDQPPEIDIASDNTKLLSAPFSQYVDQHTYDFIKGVEKFRPTIYQSTINGRKDKPTIGFGSTYWFGVENIPELGFRDGMPIQINHKVPPISKQIAEKIMAEHLKRETLGRQIERKLKDSTLTKAMLDGLVAYVYNAGTLDSTLAKAIQEKNFKKAGEIIYGDSTAYGDAKILVGRRGKEAAPFLNFKS
jgi:GH24 family phage-related lysozyme (muramidase)